MCIHAADGEYIHLSRLHSWPKYACSPRRSGNHHHDHVTGAIKQLEQVTHQFSTAPNLKFTLKPQTCRAVIQV